METEQRIVEQTRRSRRKGKSAIRNRKGEASSVREGGADVQRSRTATRDRKEEVEAQQEAGIDEEVRKGKLPIRDLKEAEQEVQRLWAHYVLARDKRALKREEERRSWLCHLLSSGRRRGRKRSGKRRCRRSRKMRRRLGSCRRRRPRKTPKQQRQKSSCLPVPHVGNRSGRVTKSTILTLWPPKLRRFAITGTTYGQADSVPTRTSESPSSERQHDDDISFPFFPVSLDSFVENFPLPCDAARIPPMMYTDKKREPGNLSLHPMQTLQIFSVKIVETTGLPWPLDVFGMVVARDVLDHNRNVIFHRTRDNCQTISTKNPYLQLTGPSRAVVVLDPVHLEVMLQVKGSDQSKDKDISFLVVQYVGSSGMNSQVRVIKRVCPSKLSTVELTYGGISHSVEATISVQVVGGSWPDGFRGEFTANTTSLDGMKIQLLAFGDGKLPVAAGGMVKLSRRVISVEHKGGLRVSVNAVDDEGVERRDSKVFRAQRASRCKADLQVGSCKMMVTIAWSLLSDDQYHSGGSSE